MAAHSRGTTATETLHRDVGFVWPFVVLMVDAVRALTLGDPAGRAAESAGRYVVGSLLWAAGRVAVFARLAVDRYRRSS